MNVLDLFSGIGGFSLGLERAGMRTVGFCEIDPYCQSVLRKHWPNVPVWGDVRTLTAEVITNTIGCQIRQQPRRGNGASGADQAQPRCNGPEGIDIICGGFPCQDISVAGKGAGIDGERSGLWSEYARIIGEVRPRYVIVENVAALLGRGLSRVLGDLAALGYDAEWHCIPASAVGAPHRRDRVWIVGYSNAKRCGWGSDDQGQASSTGNGTAPTSVDTGRVASERYGPNIREISQFNWWLTEPRLGQFTDGLPSKMDGGIGATCSDRDKPCSLPELWGRNGAQEVQRGAGRPEHVPPQDLLQPPMHGRCDEEGTGWQERLALAGATDERFRMRGLRGEAETSCSPLRWEPSEQRSGKPPDAMPVLSRFLALALEEARASNFWSYAPDGSSWEDGIPRVAGGVKNRVHRLRSLGNAIVPQIAEIIGRAIMSYEGASPEGGG
jgi:DNA (cytosine-5)-methyltransferase 1